MGLYIKVEPNVKIYVEDLNPEGEKTILFIHGWPLNHKMFEYQLDQLPKLGYRCIGIDCRGFGNSDKPWHGYDYDTLSDDIRCVIESLNLHDITLGGHSTGGGIVVRYMTRHKGYGVSKLALFAAGVPSVIQRPCFPHGFKKEDVIKIIRDTNNDRPEMWRQIGDTFFFQHISQALSDWFFQMGLQAAGWSTAAIEAMWINEEHFSDLGEIYVPTLILNGIHDKVVPFPVAVVQHEGIRNSKLVPFKYSGHGLFYEEREKFNKELTQFIEE